MSEPQIANGLRKVVAGMKETTAGVLPGPAGAKLYRRTGFKATVSRQSTASNEIAAHQQIQNMALGAYTIGITLDAELSSGAYSDFLASLLRRDMTAGVSTTADVTIALVSGTTYTLTRGAGSWLTDGFKVGDTVRISGAGVNAANVSKNLFIIAETATALTVQVVNATNLVAEADVGATIAVVGHKTFVPASGHTDDTYAFEEWQPDLNGGSSTVWQRVRPSKASIKIPAQGIVTTNITAVAGSWTNGTAQYFTSPTAAASNKPVTPTFGVMVSGGAVLGQITDMSLDIDGQVSGDPVIGSPYIPKHFQGPVKVSGSFTAYWTDNTLRDSFLASTPVDLFMLLSESGAKDSPFVSFGIPSVLLESADPDDTIKGIKRTYKFTALYNPTLFGTSKDATTITMQDSN